MGSWSARAGGVGLRVGRELVGTALGVVVVAVVRSVLVAVAAVPVVSVAPLVCVSSVSSVVSVPAALRGREFGLLVARPARAGGVGGGSPAESSTVIAIRIGRPHSRLSVSLTIGARRPSSTPFANSFGTASSAVSATSASGWQRLIQCSSFASTPCPRPSPRSCSSTRGHTAARSAGTSATGHALSRVPRTCGSWDGSGCHSGGRDERIRWVRVKGTNRSPATVVRATAAVQVVVPSLWIVSPVAAGLTGWRSRAYRDQVELSMAAAACLRWA